MTQQSTQTIDLKSLSLTELKALVYDRLTLIELTQKEIQAINQEIFSKTQSQQSRPDTNGQCKDSTK